MGSTCFCDKIHGYDIVKRNIGNKDASSAKVHKVGKNVRKDNEYIYEYYAMKEMEFEKEKYGRIQNEINILKGFEHYNVVKYIESFIEDKKYYIIMELCELDLSMFIEEKKMD